MEPVVATEYRDNGYYVARSVFSPAEVALMQTECERLSTLSDVIHQNNLRCRWNPHIGSGELLVDSLDPVVDLSEQIHVVARSPKLMGILRELLGSEVCLFKDKLLFKPPGAPGYSLHQDYIAWPEFPKSFTTALVAIDPSTLENGCLEVYQGEHKRGLLSPADGDYHDLSNAMFRDRPKISLELAPGDVAFFGCYLPHFSKANRSPSARRHLYFSYNLASEGGDQRSKHYEQYFGWLTKRYREYGYKDGFFK